jgi:hypothetical protein
MDRTIVSPIDQHPVQVADAPVVKTEDLDRSKRAALPAIEIG